MGDVECAEADLGTADDGLAEFLRDRAGEDERELKADPPRGLGYANLAARMAREIEAKRLILTAYVACAAGIPGSGDWASLRFATETLAGVYSDHPDFRKKWML